MCALRSRITTPRGGVSMISASMGRQRKPRGEATPPVVRSYVFGAAATVYEPGLG